MGVSDNLLPSPTFPLCVSFEGCADGVVGLRSFAVSFLFGSGSPVSLGVSMRTSDVSWVNGEGNDMRRTFHGGRSPIVWFLEGASGCCSGRWIRHLDLGDKFGHVDMTGNDMDRPSRA
jgi:hypothetical protein